MQRPVGLHHLAQRAIDAKVNAGVALVRLDVDVAGALAHRLRQQRVEHADDRRVVGGLQQILDLRQLLHQARQVGLAFDLADDGGGGGAAAVGVGGLQPRVEGGGGFALQPARAVHALRFSHGGQLPRGQQSPGVGAHDQPALAAVHVQQHAVGARPRVGQRVGGAHRAGAAAAGAGGTAAPGQAGGSTGASCTGCRRLGSGWACSCTPRIH